MGLESKDYSQLRVVKGKHVRVEVPGFSATLGELRALRHVVEGEGRWWRRELGISPNTAHKQLNSLKRRNSSPDEPNKMPQISLLAVKAWNHELLFPITLFALEKIESGEKTFTEEPSQNPAEQ